MSRTFLMVVHQKTSVTGRIGEKLEQRGYSLDQRCPMEGQELPQCSEEHVGAVVFGGPMSANDDHLNGIRAELNWIPKMLEADKPLLGICLGAQLMARVLDAKVATHPQGYAEIGYYPIRPTYPDCRLFTDNINVYHWHREGFEAPASATLLAKGHYFDNQAFRYGRNAYAIQFHPEVTREMMEKWMVGGAHRLELPGAQQPEQQREGHKRYDANLEAWLDHFLDIWLEDYSETAHHGA